MIYMLTVLTLAAGLWIINMNFSFVILSGSLLRFDEET